MKQRQSSLHPKNSKFAFKTVRVPVCVLDLIQSLWTDYFTCGVSPGTGEIFTETLHNIFARPFSVRRARNGRTHELRTVQKLPPKTFDCPFCLYFGRQLNQSGSITVTNIVIKHRKQCQRNANAVRNSYKDKLIWLRLIIPVYYPPGVGLNYEEVGSGLNLSNELVSLSNLLIPI